VILHVYEKTYNKHVPNFEKPAEGDIDRAPCLDGLLLHSVQRAAAGRKEEHSILPEDRFLVETCITWDIDNTALITGGGANIYQISCPRAGCLRTMILAEQEETFHILDLGDACIL
jgi:hypothetical protein